MPSWTRIGTAGALPFLAMLPALAITGAFAFRSSRDAASGTHAIATLAGANQFLIGIGWSMVVILAFLTTRRRAVRLDRSRLVDVTILGLVAIYTVFVLLRSPITSLVFPVPAALTLLDSVVYVALFVVYGITFVRVTASQPPPPRAMAGPDRRRLLSIAIVVAAVVALLFAAGVFAEAIASQDAGTVSLLLILVPLAAVAPIVVVAGLMTSRGDAPGALRILLSVSVLLWTLQVAMVPIFASLGSGTVQPIALDDQSVQNLLVATAQLFFAVAIVANLQLTLIEASILALIVAGQFAFPDLLFRLVFAFGYVVLGIGSFATDRQKIANLRLGPRLTGQLLRGSPKDVAAIAPAARPTRRGVPTYRERTKGR